MQVSTESKYLESLEQLGSNWFDDWTMDWD